MSVLSFSKHRPPILEVELPDEGCTVLHITLPTVELQEELVAKNSQISGLLEGGSKEQREGMFDLAARLMSCNRDWLKITPEELRRKYNLDTEDLVLFYNRYVEFVTRTENAKN